MQHTKRKNNNNNKHFEQLVPKQQNKQKETDNQ